MFSLTPLNPELPDHPPRARCPKVRPCPWTECRYHLQRPGDFPKSPGPETCALDVADAGPHTLAQVAKLVGFDDEWLRQIELRALEKLRE